MRVALFVTCLAEAFAPQVADAAAHLVARTGSDVEVVPVGLQCCGQPAWNAGYPAEARALARRLLPRLAEFDLVVVPSGSCATMLIRYYPHLFPPGSPLAVAADSLAARTRELTAHLAQHADRVFAAAAGRTAHGTPATDAPDGDAHAAGQAPGAARGSGPSEGDGPANGSGATGDEATEPTEATTPPRPSVAFHPSCHALRGVGVGDAGERCLEAAGCRVRPAAERDECCGFGGLFAVKEDALSVAMADRKLDGLMGAGAEVVGCGELGCLLHLEGRAQRRGLRLSFRHVAEILAGRDADD